MATVVELPRLSDTMEEGVIAKWRVQVGDKVKRGQVIADIETDKATMEFESFDSGVVLKLIAAEGDTLPLGAPIAVLGAPGENPDAAGPKAGDAARGDAEGKEAADAAEAKGVGPGGDKPKAAQADGDQPKADKAEAKPAVKADKAEGKPAADDEGAAKAGDEKAGGEKAAKAAAAPKA
ncbi:MAG: biotin/lipoyl-binding protein, partial [Tabrizicola sp.]|nr:biotin/lipoyl-binding protein [Tabrizicola sp.]